MDHGLPYFVDDIRARVHRRLDRASLALLAGAALLIGVAVAALASWLHTGGQAAFVLGSQAALVVLVAYAATALRAWVIGRWAIRVTFASLGLLFPLVTRALPLLLLFVTFLFINTEVWQVASQLDGGVMWTTVLLFTAVAVGFLLVRLPEELDGVDAGLDATGIRAGVRGTPIEAAVGELADESLGNEDLVQGLQKVNLVLVLLISQLVQVLLLAFAVFAFFLLFGVVAMDPAVVGSWLLPGDTVHPVLGDSFSQELLQVSVFLAAFSGLYFTVYAVSDTTYREQFFASVLDELQRAISVRAAYRALGRLPDA